MYSRLAPILRATVIFGAVAIFPRTLASPAADPFNVNNYPLVKPGTYDLDREWDVHAPPTTRVFDWTLDYAFGRLDGFPRSLRVINGQFPGPLIEANEGDKIIVNIQNNLEIGTTLHFHGMIMNGTNWSDGPSGITQCPIPPGHSFRYEFKIVNQFGSYWWHSHFWNTLEDGILGPLIVHSPNDPYQIGRDYDYEKLLILGDWMHDNSTYISQQLKTTPGWHAGTSTAPHSAPNPDSILINAVGFYNCSITPNVGCAPPPPPEIQVYPNTRYRFRTLNYASHAFLWLSIDNHPMTIIMADSTPVAGPTLHQFQMGMAERYDWIIDTNAGPVGSAFWLRIVQCMLSVQWIQPNYIPYSFAVLRYVSRNPNVPPSKQLPTSQDWPDSNPPGETECHDMDLSLLKPIGGPQVPKTVTQHQIWTVFGVVIATYYNPNVSGHFLWGPGGDLAHHNMTNQITPYSPQLHTLMAGGQLNATVHAFTYFNESTGADIGISNHDHNTEHPWHLHSRSFWVIAQGLGELTEAMYQNLTFNLDNPIRRDTFIIPRLSWAVIRLATDTPGMWALHCHVGWHASAGKTASIIVQPDKIRQQKIPEQNYEICQPKYWPPGVTATTETP